MAKDILDRARPVREGEELDLEGLEDYLTSELAGLREALHDIAGGHTSQYVDAPDVMTAESPAAFQHDMWTWSQRVAKDALATQGGEKG